MKKKNNLSSFLLVLIVLSLAMVSFAFRDGITGRTQLNGVGCDCHGANPTSGVMVQISGPDELNVGESANFTVTITGGPLVAGGTNIAASAGELEVIDNSGLRKQSGELTHIQPKASVSGQVTFQFRYVAPNSTGKVTLYANGNSVNLDNTPSNDQWNFAQNKTVTIVNTTGIDDENILSTYNLQQNYPNPFNPSTVIAFTIPQQEFVSLVVYDAIGRETAVLVNNELAAGKHSYAFNANGLTSGVYFYRLTTGSFSEVKKMILNQ